FQAMTQREQGQLAEAVATALKRRLLWPRKGDKLYAVAADLALTAARVGKGKTRPSEIEEKQKRECIVLAIETLRHARLAGFKDLARLKKDPAFGPFAKLREFQEFLLDPRGNSSLRD